MQIYSVSFYFILIQTLLRTEALNYLGNRNIPTTIRSELFVAITPNLSRYMMF